MSACGTHCQKIVEIVPQTWFFNTHCSRSARRLNNLGAECRPKGRQVSMKRPFFHSITSRCLSASLGSPCRGGPILVSGSQKMEGSGPLPRDALLQYHISRFGVIPKSHQPHKWHLIVYLSHPKGKSINAGIPKDLCTMTTIMVDDAIRQIMMLGSGTLLAKIDIKSAFRIIPVHPRACCAWPTSGLRLECSSPCGTLHLFLININGPAAYEGGLEVHASMLT